MREITKTVLKFFIGFVIVLVLSAFLAPWLYTFLPFKFDRILRRCIMVGTLLLVAWLVKERRESLGRLGLGWREGSLRLFGIGFLSGLLLVVALTLIQWGMGMRLWKLHQTDVWHWIGLFFKGFGGGLLIGAIEEFFFRGFLFLLFKDLWNTKASLVMTNLIYAVVHFFPKHKPPTGDATVADSFKILNSMFPSFFSNSEHFLAVAGLFLFGLVLSLAFIRTGSLFLPMGIHAGAVFGIKMNRRFITDLAHKMDPWSGTKNLYDGWVGLMVLAGVTLVFGFLVRSRKRLICAVLMLSFLFFPKPIHAASPTEEIYEPPQEIIYSFVEQIDQAEALRKQKRQIYRGEWIGKRFRFIGLPDASVVAVSDQTVVEGRARPVIQFNSLPRQESSLIFPRVSPGKRLRIFYALADLHFVKGQEVSPVEFEVWIGKKRLFEARVSARGWQDRTIDLTLPYLLQRNYRFAFRVRAPGEQIQQFVFYGYIE